MSGGGWGGEDGEGSRARAAQRVPAAVVRHLVREVLGGLRALDGAGVEGGLDLPRATTTTQCLYTLPLSRQRVLRRGQCATTTTTH
mgnify:CR=1 FL=1